jgi:HSP20 family protein
MPITKSSAGMRGTSSFDNAIDRLFQEAARTATELKPTWQPGCNVYEDEHGMTVELSVPGVDPQCIEVQIKEHTLTIQGKRIFESPESRVWHARGIPEGTFSCVFQLPPTVDQEKPAASYKHGMLAVLFPKREEAKPRRISVEVQ